MSIRSGVCMLALSAVLLAGCNLKIKDNEGKDGKSVDISSSLGDLSVNTDAVDAGDTGLSVYPGSRLKDRDKDSDNRANVNIDTPWFGVKVVALTYRSEDSPDKVWEYYKKEMISKYGTPLECRPGSPDLKKQKQDKDDLVCYDGKGSKGRHRDVSITINDMELKVGTDDRQRIVAVKSDGKGTEYALVYVATREGRETM